jgi:Aerotolerance regulator N-terminal/von Willebrand factor type A domain
MGFLAPAFLFGALAVGVPLYLHLLRRNTSVPLPFSSLMFFEKQAPNAVRRRRLRHWLLLALRLAVLLFLAFAFAEPYLTRALPGVAPEKLVLVAIDDSFSMRSGTRLEDAKQQALALLSAKRAADRAQVLSLEARVHLLTQTTQDMRTLRDAVNGIQPGDSRASFGTLASVVKSISQNEHVPIEVHLFSDLQKTAMPSNFSELALPSGATLVLHSVATPVPNWTVESVAAPRQVWDPRTVHVEAVIAGYGTPAATRTVSFMVNGKTVATRQVSVPASGRVTARMDSLDLPFGFSRGSVTIDSADPLAADDQFLFAIERTERKRGLFIYQSADTRSPLYFGTAVTSAAQTSVSLEKLSVDKLGDTDPSQYSFVVLSDLESLPAVFNDRLMQYVRRGGSVLVALGTAAAQRAEVPVFGGKILQMHHYSRDAGRFAAVGEANAALPTAGSQEEWEGVRFYYAAGIDEQGAHVAVRLQDHTPLVLEKAIGEGRVVVFTSGFDNLTNDLPLHPMFVAFAGRAVRYLSGGEAGSSSRVVDDLMPLRTERESGVKVVALDPSGQPALSLGEAATAQTVALTRAGFYTLRLATGRQDLVAVNPDRRESDLTPVAPDVLALWQGAQPAAVAAQVANGGAAQPSAGAVSAPGAAAPGAAGASSASGAQPGGGPSGGLAAAGQPLVGATPQTGMLQSSLWWYALAVLLVFVLAESAIASGYLGTPRDEP